MQKGALRWDDLRVFLEVARASRLLVAGRGLGVDPATVGRRIAALEAALGSRLFDRSQQGYFLTEAGRNLIAHAEAIESQVGALTLESGGHAGSLSGTVRIGAPDGVSTYLLTEPCDALTRDNPGLQVQLVSLPRVFPLSKRETDVAITVAPPSAGRLTVRKIADYRLGLYGRRDLVASLGAVRTMADLQGLRGIGYISDMIFDRELDYHALLGRESEPALTSNSLLLQLRWCLAGFGICVLPGFVARSHPELAILLADEVRLTRALYLVRHQDDARVSRINRIAEVVVTGIRAALAAEEG